MANAPKVPTLDDLDALPKGIKGEIIEGVLYTMTRPRSPHQKVNLRVAGKLDDPFDRGRGGPTAWRMAAGSSSESMGTRRTRASSHSMLCR